MSEPRRVVRCPSCGEYMDRGTRATSIDYKPIAIRHELAAALDVGVSKRPCKPCIRKSRGLQP